MRDNRQSTALRHRLPALAGNGVRRVLLVSFGIVAAWIVYSSLNAGLWAQYRRMVDVCWNGTRDLRDLNRIVQERTYAWGSDGLFEHYAHVDSTLIRYPLGLTGTTEMVEEWPALVAAATLLFLGCHTAVSLIQWRCVRRRLAGLDPAFFRVPEVRQARRRITERSFVVAACVLPVAGGVSWYIFYDRVQSSFERADTSTRWARYLYQSFSPRREDWTLITVCVLGAVCWYAWLACRRFVRGLDTQVTERYHRLCSACGYAIEGITGPCPECGVPHGDAARPEGWLTPRRVALGAALLAFLTGTVGVLIFRGRYEGYVYEPHWLTMRGHVRYVDRYLYLLPNRPVMLRWDGVDVWIVVQHREHGEWPTRPDFYYTDPAILVCKVGDAPAVVVERVDSQSPDRLRIGEREVLDLTLGGGPFPIPWVRTMLYVLSVRAQPEAVQGFGLSEPLTPEAARFLAECEPVVDRWLAEHMGHTSEN